ncbi:predicted protein [Naegleria gruberi]|uniref:Predicted protein n=1 Tax=Naegleria gruberi TaxID=5762 RepID=D2W4C2_NAEGR|nr:uncharacterized protein NAEGRDRAFT_76662 [Naegleria gruberi]XP_002668822.1 uncharacterized protein NAEGRDRAFT_76253 [Naegleria gruberi]EFC35682.1 predicted protein [Naegleria gruberi]EFC36078.1 predicted protein [Naegleria gruberi]|eukprot:XP_002668426.1 predicted protein [Naegleria gruberi strain NEG-M]
MYNHCHQHNDTFDRGDDWSENCPDFALLSPTNSSFKNLSSDIICYIVFQYLDYKTITSCLLLNKEYYGKIANNRFLFINMYNELFINKRIALSSVQLPVLFNCVSFSSANNELSSNCERMLLQSGRMTDEKLECIRKKWQESI